MRVIPLALASVIAGGSAMAVVTLHTVATPLQYGHHRSDRAGPDSGRIAILFSSLGRSDAVVCELISDQIGNFWSSGERAGVGRFQDHGRAMQAAKDSVSGEVTDPGAIKLLSATLSADDACIRRVAAKMLGGSTITNDRLAALLADPSPRIREAAAYAAGEGERTELRTALERMATDREIAPAAMAMWALGDLQDHASLPVLERAVRSGATKVRVAAAWALGQMEDVRAVPDVVPLLRDADASVRTVAAEALGQMKSKESGSALIGALNDPASDVREAAVRSLGDLEEHAAIVPIEARTGRRCQRRCAHGGSEHAWQSQRIALCGSAREGAVRH